MMTIEKHAFALFPVSRDRARPKCPKSVVLSSVTFKGARLTETHDSYLIVK